MKPTIITLISVLSLLLPALAQSAPVLTPENLENYQLGVAPPEDSGFPGLTAKTIHRTVEKEDGEFHEETRLEFYLDDHYVGAGKLEEGRISEIIIIDSRVEFYGGFTVGSTWDEIRETLTEPELHFTNVSDRLFIESKYYFGVQVFFSKTGYTGQDELEGERQDLKLETLKPTAKVKAIQIGAESH